MTALTWPSICFGVTNYQGILCSAVTPALDSFWYGFMFSKAVVPIACFLLCSATAADNRYDHLNASNDANWQSGGIQHAPSSHSAYSIATLAGDLPGLEFFGNTNEAWVIDCPAELSNVGECAKYKENIVLNRHPDLVSREEGTLTVHSSRKDVVLKNQSIDSQPYVVGYIPKASLMLIYVQYWEGDTHYVVDTVTGSKQEIQGVPVFNDSFTKFVTAEYDLLAQYSPNILSVFSNRNGWHKEYYVSPETWGADNPVWVSDAQIDFEKITLSNSLDSHYKSDRSLKFSDDNWQLSQR